ncbi:MAG: glycogen debranching protein GlgX [Spirochaetes bacterium]|nr:glycogen debranching protein GlgX [Spirochaetota bacterium]
MQKIKEINGLKTESGSPYLLGANPDHSGCNFAIFSKNASEVTLLLFDKKNIKKPSHTIKFDKKINKTGDIWHIYIYGINTGQYYGYSVDGPYTPEKDGHRFNKNKLLIDPYGKAITGGYKWNESNAYGYIPGSKYKDLSFSNEENISSPVKSVVINYTDYDWEDDKPLNIPLRDSIIYEMHVRGFTKHESSRVKHPGTFLGIIEKIPYLIELGITAIELLPVHEFNEHENIRINPITKEKLVNFWGYSTLSFFAAESWYSTTSNGMDAVYEFKDMIKACHKAGIEVILDVVYNHTGEGNEYGPTLNFKGFDNSIYYMLKDGRFYENYSGCGNTLNCNHPVVKSLILDSLRYWVVDMHVDGFRFDLAAILGRDTSGKWISDYSILAEISNDPILSNTKLIAEGWDAAGLYKVGDFPYGWAEWNGKYRDDVRSFIKSDPGMIYDFSKRIIGSPDMFSYRDKKPFHSINFINCHDGFTLNDLVSYNQKHNENNGENNRDGNDHNLSWNCGTEGETDNPDIMKLRERLMKNYFSTLMISLGTPMFLYGDEMKFSKKGNNNSYCHDNLLNWIDWNLIEKNRSFFEFCKFMINFRKNHHALRRSIYFSFKDFSGNTVADINWYGIIPDEPKWEYHGHCFSFLIDGSKKETGYDTDDDNIYIAYNSYWKSVVFKLPKPLKDKNWRLAIDTFNEPSFYENGKEPIINTESYEVRPRSMIILIDKK